MARKINLIDVTLRDAHQCLWATRMTTAMMQPLASHLDNAGFEAIDLVGGAVFDVAVRFLREDPWERMRILSKWITKTRLILHHRGQSLFTFKYFPDDVVELTAERMVANGMRYHTTYDALNDIRNLEVPIRAAKALGVYTVAGFVYTVSPVHTDEYYVAKIREMAALGADAIFLKDPSGLLTPERAITLIPAAKKACGNLPLQVHSHCLSGLAPYVLLKCAEYGADVLHTATSTLANGASHPPTENVASNLRRMGFEIDVDVDEVAKAADKLRFIAQREHKPVGTVSEYDAFHYHHQVPGGMISNLQAQLERMGIPERLEELLQEAGEVRKDLGYPIMVSPFAQYVITQAMLNITGSERYGVVADEIRQYVLGYFGKVPGTIEPNLFDRLAQGREPVVGRPGDYLGSQVAKARAQYGANCSDDDILLRIFYNDTEYRALKAAGPISVDYSMGETPLVALARGVKERRWVRKMSLRMS